VLVTGRIVDELLGVFPDAMEHFDAVVAENGAVLCHAGTVRALAQPVEQALDGALDDAGVPFRRGRVLLATSAGHAATIGEAVRRLGLECHLVTNRSELMVLPAGVSKGSGVVHGLAEVGVSRHNAIAIGDAENDHSLLAGCEVGVAVANAVDSLRAHADIVTIAPYGDGVLEALRGDALASARALHPSRCRVEIGVDDRGAPVCLPAARANLLIAGPSGSGKSYVTGLIAERLVHLEYSVLLMDPEGDYRTLTSLPGVISVGGIDSLPPPYQLVSLLTHRFGSVVVDLTERSEKERAQFFALTPAVLEAYRSATGLPHWVIVDEAHGPLGHAGASRRFFAPEHGGYLVVTYEPGQLCDEVLAATDVAILLPGTLIDHRCRRLLGEPDDELEHDLAALEHGQAVVFRRREGARGEPRRQKVTLAPRETPHVRHRHKYVTHALAPDRRFYFRSSPDAPTGAQAGNLVEFHREIARCGAAVIVHHAARRDFSRWIDGVFADHELADGVRRIEEGVQLETADAARDALLVAIETRYLAWP
jgi:hypothetical protein